MKTFGEWIKNERLKKNVKVRELARRLGIKSNQRIIYTERSEKMPREENLKQHCDALELDWTEVLLASGKIPEKYLPGVRRNMREIIRFLRKMQKV